MFLQKKFIKIYLLQEAFLNWPLTLVFWGWWNKLPQIQRLKTTLVAQIVKNLSAMQDTWVWSLGWDDPLEKGMATHSIFLPGEFPWTEEPGRLQSMGSQRVSHDWAQSTKLHKFIILQFCGSLVWHSSHQVKFKNSRCQQSSFFSGVSRISSIFSPSPASSSSSHYLIHGCPPLYAKTRMLHLPGYLSIAHMPLFLSFYLSLPLLKEHLLHWIYLDNPG